MDRLLLKNAGIALSLMTAVFLLRLPFVGAYPDGWDGADFILALQKFDILQQRPHFPGYPVYIFVAQIFKALGFSYHLSLLLPGLIFQGLALWLIAQRLLRIQALSFPLIVLAVLLCLFHPMISLWSLKVGSESLACSMLVIACLRFPLFLPGARGPGIDGSYFSFGIILGLVLGVRLSYWPFVLGFTGLIFQYHAGRSPLVDMAKGLACAIGLWLIPLVALSGGPLFYSTAMKFIQGHFFRWGGSAFADGDFIGRCKLFAWCVTTQAGAGPWSDLPLWRVAPGILGTGLSVYGFVKHPDKAAVAWLLLPYALWVFIGQNLGHPRHFYPMALVFIWCAFSGLKSLGQRIRPRWSFAAGLLLILFWMAESFSLSNAYRSSIPPQVQLVRHLKNVFPGTGTLLFCGQSYRMFDLYYPVTPRIKTGSIQDMLKSLEQKRSEGAIALFTSELQPLSLLSPASFQQEATFNRSRYLDNETPVITLYRYRY